MARPSSLSRPIKRGHCRKTEVMRCRCSSSCSECLSRFIASAKRRRAAKDARQRQVLEKALLLFARFAQDESSDPNRQRDAGRAWRRLGGIRFRFGQLAEAEQAQKQAIARLQDLT